MAQPVTIHSAYAGMAQDFARDQLPAATVWNLIDFIPNILGAPLRKRGGWTYASSAISAATFLQRILYGTPGTGNPALLAVDSTTSTSAGPGVWKVNETTGALTFIGSITSASNAAAAANTPMHVGDPLIFGKRIFIPVGYNDSYPDSTTPSGTYSNCVYYDGTTLQKIQSTNSTTAIPVGGARYIASYKSRLMLANTPADPRIIWFNQAGSLNGDKFNDPLAYLKAPIPITGIVGLSNAILVFGDSRALRIRGSIPPPGSDFVVENLSEYGCSDYRSIATWSGKAIYANTDGIFITDAIDTTDLTQYAGMSGYYRSLLSGFTSSWTLRGSVFRNYYFLVVQNASGTFQDCLVCDLRARSFFRLSNFNFNGFTVGSGQSFGQFFAAPRGTNRVVKLNDIFAPTTANKNDADGTAVLPVVEYPCRRGYVRQMRRWLQTQGLTKWLRLYFSYDLRDAASDNPTLSVSYVTTPESTSYTTLSRTLAETTADTRQGLSFGPSGARGGKTALALGLKVTQTAASSDTRLYTVEGEMDALEGSRLAQ